MANVIIKPEFLAYIFANIKIEYEALISQFCTGDGWSWKEFTEIWKGSVSPVNDFFWIVAKSRSKGERTTHFLKIRKLILNTAKEFWLPRFDMVEDDFIQSLNTSFRFLSLDGMSKEKENLQIASKVANFKRRLGGLYLLSALYWNQPCAREDNEHIDMTASDFEKLKEFEKDAETLCFDNDMEEVEREKFTKQIKFLINQFKVSGAFDFVIFAESYGLTDHLYLNTKYSQIIAVNEFEKHLKERLIFHPVVVEAIKAHDKALEIDLEMKLLRHEANDRHALSSDNDGNDDSGNCEGQATQSNRASTISFDCDSGFGDQTNSHLRSFDNHTDHTYTQTYDHNGHSFFQDERFIPKRSRCTSGEGNTQTDQSTTDKINLLKMLLHEAMLTPPYKIQDLLSEKEFLRYVKYRTAEPKQPTKAKPSKSRIQSLLKKKNTTKSVNFTDPNNLTPVLKALGLPPEIPKQNDLKSYIEAIEGCNLGMDTINRPDPRSTSKARPELRIQPEWNLVYTSNREEVEKSFMQMKTEAEAIQDSCIQDSEQPILVDKPSKIEASPAPSDNDDDCAHNEFQVSSPESNVETSSSSEDEEEFERNLTQVLGYACRNNSNNSIPEPSHARQRHRENDDDQIRRIIQELTNVPNLIGKIK